MRRKDGKIESEALSTRSEEEEKRMNKNGGSFCRRRRNYLILSLWCCMRPDAHMGRSPAAADPEIRLQNMISEGGSVCVCVCVCVCACCRPQSMCFWPHTHTHTHRFIQQKAARLLTAVGRNKTYGENENPLDLQPVNCPASTAPTQDLFKRRWNN